MRDNPTSPMNIRCCWLLLLAGCSSSVSTPSAPPSDVLEQPESPPVAAREAERPPGVIYREEVDAVAAAGPAVLLRNLGPEPVREDGQFAGWKITRVFPEFPGLCAESCDLHPGDIIVSVNGDKLATPDAFAAAFDRLPTVDALEVVRIRDGQRSEITYAIVRSP